VSGIAISGADAGNYAVNGSTTAVATITQATLLVTATGTDKVYDGGLGASATIAGTALAGDSVAFSFDSAAFGDKNAGADKSVSVAGIRASGADAGNYSINTTAATTADITPATLIVAAVGHSKPFDNNTVADVTLSDNRIAGDQLSIETDGAAFADPDIGNDKPVTVSGIQIAGGADAGNYVLASDSAASAADITGPLLADASRTSSLPPVLPQPLPPVSQEPPDVLLDTTLPVSFGREIAAPEVEPNRLTAEIVRAPSSGQPGQVSVLVPENVLWSGIPFIFPLPAALSEAAGSKDVRVTLRNGSALPTWLRYVPINKTFIATATPVNALPIDVLVYIGKQSWIVTIAKP
jgi:hypothetical protein